MILIVINLALLSFSITFAVKSKKKAAKVLPIFIVLLESFYLYSIYSFPIPSLVKKEFPENYKIIISEEIKEKLSNDENESVFNDMKFKKVSEDKRWSQGKNKIISFEDEDCISDYDSSYFVIKYYDFYNEDNAEKAFKDIIFFTNDESHSSQYTVYMPFIMRRLSDDNFLDKTRYVSGLLIKKVRDNPQMITSYSISERWNFAVNPLLGGLPGEYYHSVFAYRDEQYIMVIHEQNNTKDSNMFEMLEYCKDH